ncbi:hypothetical protein BDY17DRAFT_293904 [Neohortaea acidophila]|uniref:Uncharacterized protein n=1 Tax=Neohortaea acidophila TaxID=245834 RepID=A0A6A6PZK1_9PEZI|nr:uncharacterized protein BDY17DRAFT_293904 [Neohortaea acidophila]KAF2485570.1 hypothetical protein BDY17DRAFT_293904 [Neohortaea acidophila]
MALKRLKKRVRDFLGRGHDSDTPLASNVGRPETALAAPSATTVSPAVPSTKAASPAIPPIKAASPIILPRKVVNAPDVPRTEDTAVQTQMAPAVTHETVQRNVHEIRHEQIYRDIHEHHVVHRVQPIVVKETLPARHFVMVDGVKREVSEEGAKAMGYMGG